MSSTAGLSKYQEFIKAKKNQGMSHQQAIEAWRQINPKKQTTRKNKKQTKQESSSSEESSSGEVDPKNLKKPYKKVVKYYRS